ncbi:hypothetical protein H6F89_28220 [Cyanobacteria bacterium FACHB-63]|nr:hypothetical protein [Cyanobacteria bacterium FACHB-63]
MTSSKLATNALKDPKLLEQIVDRVYHLIREDLQRQQERVGNYGTFRR